MHNGDPLTGRTVHVPAGRPITGDPPFPWDASSIDALKGFGLDNLNSDDLTSTLNAIERSNGIGYRARGVSSPETVQNLGVLRSAWSGSWGTG